MTKARKDTLWIIQFLVTLKYRLPSQLVNLKVDNRGTILLASTFEFHYQTKYIKVWHQ